VIVEEIAEISNQIRIWARRKISVLAVLLHRHMVDLMVFRSELGESRLQSRRFDLPAFGD
jgi:hypothetical protein